MSIKEYLLFGSLTAIAVLMVIWGEPGGYLVLLFFGGGGAIYWYGMRDRTGSPSSRPRHGSLAGAERHVGETRGMVFVTGRGATVAGAVGAAIFVVVGFFLISATPPDDSGSFDRFEARVVGGACVAFFGGVLVSVLRLLLWPGGLALFPRGVYWRHAGGSVYLPWESIEEVSVIDLLGLPCVGFQVPSLDPTTLHGTDRWFLSWYRRRSGADALYLPVPGGSVSVKKAYKAVRHYHLRSSERERLSDRSEAERW